MTEEGQPVPQRIGDAERDRAVELLREHMAAGRLTAEEFDERLGTALSARTSADLDPLFTDLPGPRPGQGVATTATPPWTRPAPAAPTSAVAVPADEPENPGLRVLTAIMWPVTILAITFVPGLGWGSFWWLVFLPMIISSALGRDMHGRRQRERERERLERDQRELDRRRRALGD